MTLGYIIREASSYDLAQINAFDPFAGDRRAEIERGRMLVIQAGGKIIAYISWMPGGFVGRDYITFLCVHPDHRRRGFAVALLKAIERSIGNGRLFVSTEDDNTAMLALLSLHGWTNAGAISGANEQNRAEVFFYKDLTRAGT